MPFIRCKTCSVFRVLKKGFQGGSLGNSLDRIKHKEEEKSNLGHIVLRKYNELMSKVNKISAMYIHDQSILFQTVTQPHKITVTPSHTGSLFSKAHAIGLQEDISIHSSEKSYNKCGNKAEIQRLSPTYV